jgi:heptosyltransferase-1
MTRILIVKTSSLGDIIHTLPALTDAANAYPDVRFDWVVEEAFSEIPRWHSNVDEIIPVALRRWRKQPLVAYRSGELKTFYKKLREKSYDLVIDAQGLVKSALITRLARGTRAGLDRHSAWEPLACLAYQQRHAVLPLQHAVSRVRQLFAAALDYSVPTDTADYGILKERLAPLNLKLPENYLVFLHGTTWDSKHWPEEYWISLAKMAADAGYAVLLPWGSAREQQRAERISAHSSNITVLPKLKLAEVASVLAHAKAAVAVDTGLGHLAAALAVPTISLYGPTDPKLTGTHGKNQQHIAAQFSCAPCLQPRCAYTGESRVQPACFGALTPERVWASLRAME